MVVDGVVVNDTDILMLIVQSNMTRESVVKSLRSRQTR
jgi:hypothetical protein